MGKVAYELEKDDSIQQFESEKDACDFLEVPQGRISSYFGKGLKCNGWSIRKLDTKSRKSESGARERLYGIYYNIKSRCYNEKDHGYERYGGRGIVMCDEWKNSYDAFKKWALSSGYNENARYTECTIERVDVNGNYSPENCCWKSMKEQANNKRTNLFIEYNEETHTLSEWSEILNIPYTTLQSRICSYGWDIEKAFTTPIKTYPTYTYNGETHTILEWSKILGVSRSTLSDRIYKYKWDIDRVLTQDINKINNTK